jgi:NAD(P)H-hydrate epimerase
MKVLSAAQMREVDRATIERGIPGLILMENAAHRVVEFLVRRFDPLKAQRIAILCGKGNNGGDGLAIARQLLTRFAPRSLDVVIAAEREDLQGDAAENLRMFEACGGRIGTDVTAALHEATLVIDALLGTGVKGAASGLALEWIEQINAGFPHAKVVAVDLPSGMASDRADNEGICARADATVTFTAPKICHALPPNCDRVGELHVAPIGSPAFLYQDDASVFLSLAEKSWFRPLFEKRSRGAHKGDFGHVLTIGGSVGKTGAASMAGVSALRAGAGLVTVASAASALPSIASHAPELMTEPLPETDTGSIATSAYPLLAGLTARKNVIAAGPGMGVHPDTVAFARRLYEESPLPVVLDADGLNALTGPHHKAAGPRILTPHPGEMARLCGSTAAQVQENRCEIARRYATESGATVVLKGQRTLLAFPDGRVWINPTGTPAMATGGSGDILTGLIAGLLAQFPAQADLATAAAVWLHGRAGEFGAARLGEKCLIATDLLRFLPEAMRELENL